MVVIHRLRVSMFSSISNQLTQLAQQIDAKVHSKLSNSSSTSSSSSSEDETLLLREIVRVRGSISRKLSFDFSKHVELSIWRRETSSGISKANVSRKPSPPREYRLFLDGLGIELFLRSQLELNPSMQKFLDYQLIEHDNVLSIANEDSRKLFVQLPSRESFCSCHEILRTALADDLFHRMLQTHPFQLPHLRKALKKLDTLVSRDCIYSQRLREIVVIKKEMEPILQQLAEDPRSVSREQLASLLMRIDGEHMFELDSQVPRLRRLEARAFSQNELLKVPSTADAKHEVITEVYPRVIDSKVPARKPFQKASKVESLSETSAQLEETSSHDKSLLMDVSLAWEKEEEDVSTSKVAQLDLLRRIDDYLLSLQSEESTENLSQSKRERSPLKEIKGSTPIISPNPNPRNEELLSPNEKEKDVSFVTTQQNMSLLRDAVDLLDASMQSSPDLIQDPNSSLSPSKEPLDASAVTTTVQEEDVSLFDVSIVETSSLEIATPVTNHRIDHGPPDFHVSRRILRIEEEAKEVRGESLRESQQEVHVSTLVNNNTLYQNPRVWIALWVISLLLNVAVTFLVGRVGSVSTLPTASVDVVSFPNTLPNSIAATRPIAPLLPRLVLPIVTSESPILRIDASTLPQLQHRLRELRGSELQDIDNIQVIFEDLRTFRHSSAGFVSRLLLRVRQTLKGVIVSITLMPREHQDVLFEGWDDV